MKKVDAKRYPTLAAVLAEAPNEPGYMAVSEESDPSLKPPKKWANKMLKEIKKNNPSYSQDQVDKTMGDIWYHKLDKAKKSEIREREGKHYGPAHGAHASEEDSDGIYSAEDMKGWVN